MDVFGNTFDSEKKQLITNLEDSIKILSAELNDKIIIIENKIKTQEEIYNTNILQLSDQIKANEAKLDYNEKYLREVVTVLQTRDAEYFNFSRKETVGETTRT